MTASPRPVRAAASPRLLAALLSLVVVAVLALSSCGGAGTAAGQATGPGEPRPGGTLDYRAAAGGRSLDPAATTGYGLAIPLRALVDSLVFHSIDGEFRPWLAESWEINEDATRYVFHLRDGVTFSNGEPLDANAVVASFESIRRAGAKYAVANTWIGPLSSITAPDPKTVVFEFASPNSSFLQAVSTAVLGIVAPQTSALSFEERQQGLSIIGSGPFVATENRNEEGYRLERRPDYRWPPAGSPNPGPAYLDAIEVHHISDNSIAANQLQAGELDVLHNTEPADKTLFATHPEITIRREPLPGSALGFTVNIKHPLLQDVRVRQALQLAIDREAVLQRASAIDIPATSVFSASNPFWVDRSEKIRTDRERAAALLDEAGWVRGPDGIRVKDGQRLSLDLIYTASTISHEPNIAVVQAQWKELGVELTFGSLTTPEHNQRIQNGDYALSWGSGTRPDIDVLRGTYAGYDPVLDGLFTEILRTPDVHARKELATQVADRILDQAYFIPLYDFIQPIAYRNTVGLRTFEATHIPWLGDAWINEES